MDKTELNMAQQLAAAAKKFQLQQTGRAPTKVTVIISEDTLVVTLHEALSPAEQALAKNAEGAANLREYHQQLFRNSVGSLRKDIERITGRKVREAAAEVDPGTGSVIHAFTTGTTVQVFLLADSVPSEISAQQLLSRAEQQAPAERDEPLRPRLHPSNYPSHVDVRSALHPVTPIGSDTV